MGEYVEAWQKSFLAALGEFDPLELDSYSDGQWLVFILCVIFNIILLLNLLIAIISETYERVSRTRIPTAYKEKAQNIGQMQDTIFGLRRKKQVDPNERIFVAKAMQ